MTDKINSNFGSFGLHQNLTNSLWHAKFENPTDIQSLVIPTAMNGTDILASSKTGSGKTLAFCVPAINSAISDKNHRVLILVPTREIATQVAKIVFDITKSLQIRSALLIGGEMMMKQKKQLSGNPQILIGTPGRINDYIERKMLKLDYVKTMILDEADRMLDMGFDVQIREIFKYIHPESQKLMFSATMPKKIERLANEYLKNPEFITNIVHEDLSETIKDVTQISKKAGDFEEKINLLLAGMDGRNGTVIIFANTKSIVEKISDILLDNDFSCEFIHGDLKQSIRSRIIEKYRSKKYQILVATDVLARGLDVDHIEYVVNFDMPSNFDEYIHRIGRTNRHSGSKGEILNLVAKKDFPVFSEICAKIPGINQDGIDFGRSGIRNGSSARKGSRTGFNNKDRFGDRRSSQYGNKRRDSEFENERSGRFNDKDRDFSDKPRRARGEFTSRRDEDSIGSRNFNSRGNFARPTRGSSDRNFNKKRDY